MAGKGGWLHDDGRVCVWLGGWFYLVDVESPYTECFRLHSAPLSEELRGAPVGIGEWAMGPDSGSVVEEVHQSIPFNGEVVTDDAKYIMSILPGIIDTFLEKNRKYAEVERGYDLGAGGIIPDLNRKLGILVARMWYGAEEVGEPTDEVIGDMIGHLLLMLAKRNNDKKEES